MSGFFGALFSAPGAISKVTDAVIKSGDALVFTEEERSRASQKQLEWILKYHQATSGSNLARRVIAIMVMGVFLTLILVTAGLIVFDVETYKALIDLVSDTLAIPVSLVVGFYYYIGVKREKP